MNKKLLIKFVTVVITFLVVVFAWLFIVSWNYQRNNPKQNSTSVVNTSTSPTARDAADWNEPFMRPIEVKFLDREDLAKMGLGSDPMIRVQVLERDAKGNVTAYKKVYKDDDIVRYMYDPKGATSSVVITATTTKTK